MNGNGSEDPNDKLIHRLLVGQRKMATLSTSSVLHYLPNKDVDHDDTSTSNEWPILQCQNIFMHPGVPPYFEGITPNAGVAPKFASNLPQVCPLSTDLAPRARVAAPISNNHWKREAN